MYSTESFNTGCRSVANSLDIKSKLDSLSSKKPEQNFDSRVEEILFTNPVLAKTPFRYLIRKYLIETLGENSAREVWLKWLNSVDQNDNWGEEWTKPCIGQVLITSEVLETIDKTLKGNYITYAQLINELKNKVLLDYYSRIRVWNPVTCLWELESKVDMLQVIKKNIESRCYEMLESIEPIRLYVGDVIKVKFNQRIQEFVDMSSNINELKKIKEELLYYISKSSVRQMMDNYASDSIAIDRNKVCDLTTRVIRNRERNDYFIKSIPSKEPIDEKTQIPPPIIADYFESASLAAVQVILGSLLLGKHSTCFYIFHGSGSNGKSTLIDVLSKMLNGYVVNVPSDIVTKKDTRKLEYDLELQFRRVAVIDLIGNYTIDIEKLVSLTDTYKGCKFVLSLNELPKLDMSKYYIERRIVYLHFPNKFVTYPTNNLEKKRLAKVDIDYNKLFWWLVDGCREELYANNETLFGTMPNILDLTAKLKEQLDPISQFITNEFIKSNSVKDRIKFADMYKLYEQMVYSSMRDKKSYKEFVNRVKQDFMHKRYGDGLYFVGIGLREIENTENINTDTYES